MTPTAQPPDPPAPDGDGAIASPGTGIVGGTHPDPSQTTAVLSRRALLGAAAAGTAGLVVGGVAGQLVPGWSSGTQRPSVEGAVAPTTYPFHGVHQAGVTTPAQDHLHFAVFDMVAGTDRRDLVRLLRAWSDGAARMTQGLPVGPFGALDGDPQSPPDDTGEALDLPAGGLTITIGFGPGLFEHDGVDRFGIGHARPPELEPLPSFDADAIRPTWSGGDLAVQACADDPQIAAHAIRNLARIADGRAAVRWSQLGFGRTARTTLAQSTPRNLMGFKDGTANLVAEDAGAINEHVWIAGSSAPSWLAGGTYLVIRKIELLVEDWDREPLSSQELIVGRTKGTGAPLSGGQETTAPDFEVRVGGAPAIDPTAHIRLAHPSANGGMRILRRGYNYVDGHHPDGRLDAGLVFIAYQRSPAQFIAIQRSLATDRLNEYIRHVGSGVFVVPPGAAEGDFVGQTLLG